MPPPTCPVRAHILGSARIQAALFALLLALPCLALLASTQRAEAGDLDFSADTGATTAKTATTAWPDRIVVDATTWTLLAIWTGTNPHQQVIPMTSIDRFERARAWEGRPDELVATLKDGSRLLVARGESVGSAAMLLTALVGRQITEISSGASWPTAVRDDGTAPDTSLALGSVHTGAQVAAVLGTAPADRISTQGQLTARHAQVYDVNEELPANADANALKAATIQVAIKQQMRGIRQCYQRELRRDPSLAGKVIVWFLIDTDGTVSRARLKETTMSNVVVEDCIVAQVTEMSFPHPQGAKVVPVSFPFRFSGN
ncbi:MAG: AgmX/PglI C-terminal domain-containing protein [Oligoflexia bacterium]|nr:AgmX/PglI C-terminal domain-containing protein [Oligoflexia bacterium]